MQTTYSLDPPNAMAERVSITQGRAHLVVERLARGAVGGFFATLPMTAVMLVIQRFLPPDQNETLEPRQISDEGLRRVDSGVAAKLTEREQREIATIAHFAYGAAAGAPYPLVRSLVPQVRGTGLAYGLGLFALSYAGWLPALDVLPPPQQRPSGRNVLLLASHLVWGAALEYCSRESEASHVAPDTCR